MFGIEVGRDEKRIETVRKKLERQGYRCNTLDDMPAELITCIGVLTESKVAFPSATYLKDVHVVPYSEYMKREDIAKNCDYVSIVAVGDGVIFANVPSDDFESWGKAKCGKNDEYDFGYGAILALMRRFPVSAQHLLEDIFMGRGIKKYGAEDVKNRQRGKLLHPEG